MLQVASPAHPNFYIVAMTGISLGGEDISAFSDHSAADMVSAFNVGFGRGPPPRGPALSGV